MIKWIQSLLLALALAALPLVAFSDQKPNVIFIFVDDHGYGDIGAYGHLDDVRTPNLDQLAADGVLFTRGYVTAPQCIPSRAAVVVGRHQNAFGLDDNLGGPLSRDEFTVPERLQEVGYVTGMIGKWHLEIGFDENMQVFYERESMPDRHGFEEMFAGYMQRYSANFDLDGNTLPGENYSVIDDQHFRVDIQTRAALAFLERRKTDDRPFFLYLCWFAPHSPIEGPPQYMERLAHVEQPIRRKALASILAMDDGLKMIRDKLEAMGQTENTLIFFISDNGAPLVEGNYIGSFNEPLTGEKGMLIDGGQRVPFIAAWPGRIPGGQVFDEMVWSLDATATTLKIANAPIDDRIEGVNLIPWLTGERQGPVHEALYWRWRSQAAILTNDWTFVRVGNERRYLFATDELGAQRAEHNRINDFPELAQRLENQLLEKANTWTTPGLPDQAVAPDIRFFDMHVDGNLPFPPMEDGRTCAFIPWDNARPQTAADAPSAVWNAVAHQRTQRPAPSGAPIANAARMQGWFVRQGEAVARPDGIRVVSNVPTVRTFIGRSFADRLIVPVTVEVDARANTATNLSLMWLGGSGTSEADFRNEPAAVLDIPAGNDWSTVSAEVRAAENIAILRMILADNGEIPVEIRSIRLREANGNVREFNFKP